MSLIRLTTNAEPSTPPAGKIYVWVDSTTGNLTQKNDAGVVSDFIGPAGADGTNGTNGTDGTDGIDGTNGADGKTVLSGIIDPTTEGVDGDFYINTATSMIFGPRSAGTWPAGVSLVGPAGTPGTDGTDGTDGQGVPTGGTTGQLLSKIDGTDYNTEWTDPPTSAVWGAITGTLSDQTDLQGALDAKADSIGPTSAFAGYDITTGILGAIPGFNVNTNTRGLTAGTDVLVEDVASDTLHQIRMRLDPQEDSPATTWNTISLATDLDPNSTGFDLGTGGNGARQLTMDYFHFGTSDVGSLDFITMNLNIGNGTDPVDVNGIGYAYGFGNFNANVNISGPLQGYGFQPNVNAAASFSDNSYITAFYDSANIGPALIDGYTSFAAYPNIASIPSGRNYQGYSLNPNISNINSNGGFIGVGINPTIGNMGSNSYFQGINVNPNVSNARYATGLNVSMDNVSVYPGAHSVLTLQDLTFTFNQAADQNGYTLEYTPGATAGSEVVGIAGQSITIQIEDGVSTAAQIKAAAEANFSFNGAVTVTITGTGSNAQTIDGPASFSGGVNPGTKIAAYLDGDVQVTGALSFGGALAIGQLNAFASYTLVDGGGNPGSVHTLISGMNAAPSSTTANADTLGVNTAALIDIGAGATVTTAFLGVTALGLPAVVNLGAGATIDHVAGSTFAISLQAGGSGTIDEVDLCQALALPNGGTVVNKLYGYKMALPFGNPATNAWGLYIQPSIYNYMAGSLKVGTGADTTAYTLEVAGDVALNGDLGFYGTTPVAQPASSGAASAGVVYTATEQTMLQEVYDAVRALGLMT